MIHFFLTVGKDAGDSPFAMELRASGLPHQLFSDRIYLRYRARIWLLLFGWPKIFAFALRSAWKSRFGGLPRPDNVVLGSDIEVLVFGLLRALTPAPRTRITLLGFIFTQRRSALLNALRLSYFRIVLSFADVVVCYSATEIDGYRRTFAGLRTRFVHILYGMHVDGLEAAVAQPYSGPRYIVAAGRSGRDYGTLFDAVDGLGIEVHVVCDNDSALAGLDAPENVKVLRQCYGDAYLRELAKSCLVVVPLAVDNISAGQMVMIQAMAFGKPIVVTRTPTIKEYATEGEDVVLVPRKDARALRQAIADILAHPAEAERMGRAAAAAYEARFSIRTYVRSLVSILSPPAIPIDSDVS